MNKPPTVQVNIGGKVLSLSPLDRMLVPSAWTVCNRLEMAAGKPVNEHFFADIKAALDFVFLSAKVNHPELTGSDMERATAREICGALGALALVTLEHFANLNAEQKETSAN